MRKCDIIKEVPREWQEFLVLLNGGKKVTDIRKAVLQYELQTEQVIYLEIFRLWGVLRKRGRTAAFAEAEIGFEKELNKAICCELTRSERRIVWQRATGNTYEEIGELSGASALQVQRIYQDALYQLRTSQKVRALRCPSMTMEAQEAVEKRRAMFEELERLEREIRMSCPRLSLEELGLGIWAQRYLGVWGIRELADLVLIPESRLTRLHSWPDGELEKLKAAMAEYGCELRPE